MARIYERSEDIPEHTGPLPPGRKPAVRELPNHEDHGDPEEVDRFLELIRAIRRYRATAEPEI